MATNDEALRSQYYHVMLKKRAKPCPFCDSKNLYMMFNNHVLGINGEPGRYVFCLMCGGSTGMEFSDYDALREWNRRGGQYD